MSGLIGKKVGMTSVYDDSGNHLPVTVIEIEPNVITQIFTEEKDGYNGVQLAAFDKKEKNTSKALIGHFDKAGTSPKKVVKEIRDYIPEGLEVGDLLSIDDVFQVDTGVNVVGTSKGKGFAGVMKRHNFHGVGGQTHGQHNRERAPGAIGQASDPSRVFKGVKMAGQHGNSRTLVKRLRIVQILSDSNLLLVKGSVPGAKGSYVEVYNS